MTKSTLERHQDGRAQVRADVRPHAQAILDIINTGRADGLFPDGLTPELQRAIAVNQMLAIEPVEAGEPAPIIAPALIQPPEA